ncbi:MAG: rubredoxin [Mogibacterium sp.]|nr:rubredoxin [Mogibacterium sp.]
MKYICSVCGYVYDEEKEGEPFAALPEDWVCPWCGAPKSVFQAEAAPAAEPGAARTDAYVHAAVDEDLKRLPASAFAALCSNLARGCEKQYKPEESALFRELADYFAAVAPPATSAELADLAALIGSDLEEGYPALRSAAVHYGDRGTQRICVWGEKVTRLLQSLVDRVAREGAGFLAGTGIWICTVCGFVYIGDEAPAACPVCKVPAWKFEKIEGRAEA